MGEDHQVLEGDLAVRGGVALAPIAWFVVVLGEGDKVAEVDSAVAGKVAGKGIEGEFEVAAGGAVAGGEGVGGVLPFAVDRWRLEGDGVVVEVGEARGGLGDGVRGGGKCRDVGVREVVNAGVYEAFAGDAPHAVYADGVGVGGVVEAQLEVVPGIEGDLEVRDGDDKAGSGLLVEELAGSGVDAGSPGEARGVAVVVVNFDAHEGAEAVFGE